MFVTPIFLLGALLAVIPVIIHLLFRRRAPQVFFSTIRFLQLCVRKAARRRRIENLLLLIFRMLLFGLLAVALARPFLKSSLAEGSGPASTVIVLDNSYSMGTRQQGVERFAHAKDAARRLVREMSERDSVALILTGGPRAGDKVQLTHRLNEVHSTIANAEIFAGHTNVITPINRAFEVIRGSGDANREVIVITDLQEKSLEGELGAAVFSEKDVPIIIYDCGQEAVVNLAVTGLTFKGGTRLGGRVSTLVAQVFNPTESEIKDARVTLYVDNKAVKEQRVTVLPHARNPVHFRYPFTEARTITGWVQLSDDSLICDNRYNFRIAASDRIKVLVLRDERAAISYLDEGYYVVRALDPRTTGDAGAVSPIEPHLRLTGELDKIVLDEYAAVFLLNVRGLDLAAVGKLRRFAEAGGMVVLFMGDRVDVSRYADVFSASGVGLFPASLQRAVGDAEKRQEVWQMSVPDFGWGGFARLKAIPPALFERVRAYEFYTIDGYDEEKVEVLTRLSSKTATPASAPLLASARLGDGEVFFFAVPGTTGWTNFPATKVFVPMLHEMVYAVTGKTGRLESVRAGQPKRFDFGDVQGEVTVSVEVRPGTMEVRKSTHDASGNTVVFENTYRPGIYRYVLSGATGGEDYFVVNPDTRESELARMSDSGLRGKFSATRMFLVRSPERLAAERLRLREGHPLSGYVFLLIIAIAGLELFLANRTRPARLQQQPQMGAAR